MQLTKEFEAMMVIKRYFNNDYMPRVIKDVRFLVNKVNDSYGEIDLQLRDNYFNIYYKGNSAAKIKMKQLGYEIIINKKFISKENNENFFAQDPNFQNRYRRQGDYYIFQIDGKLLRLFFQKKYLDKICKNIKKVNYGEEITFEQMLMTDNAGRSDLIIIDRQIEDKQLKGRMDLLALEKVCDNRFQFLIIEVKLGKSEELGRDAYEQLKGYIDHVEKNFDDYKKCYELNYKQKKQMGLVHINNINEIIIERGVHGQLVILGYSGLGEKNKKKMLELETHNEDIKINQIKFII